MDNDSNLSEEAKALGAEPQAIIRAGSSHLGQFLLGTTPWAGGIGAVLSLEAQRRQDERLRGFLVHLVDDVERLRTNGREFDEDFFESEEFVAVVAGVLREVGSSPDETRLRYLRSFLSSAALTQRPDATWLDLFLKYLPRLSGVHIVVLNEIYKVQQNISARDRMGSTALRGVPVQISDVIKKGYGIELRRLALVDLDTLGLIADWRMLSGQGAAQEAYSLTRNGHLFMRFLNGDWRLPPTELPLD